MSKIVKIGRPSQLCGKRVFEILCNLKNFGAGRVLERISLTNKYGEKTFFIIKQAYPQMDRDLAFGRAYSEEYFKEKRIPGIKEMETHHPDYRLIPRHLEQYYFDIASKAQTWGQDAPRQTVAQYLKLAPVMSEVLNRHKLNRPPCLYIKGVNLKDDGYDSNSLLEFKIPAVYKFDELDELRFRIADEDSGEVPPPSERSIYCNKLLDGTKPI